MTTPHDKIDHYRGRLADPADPIADLFPVAIAADKLATALTKPTDDAPAPSFGDDSYLGDGVYASFDGYDIVLDLRAQDSTTRIALEPAVMDALIVYRARLRAKYQHRKDVQP